MLRQFAPTLLLAFACAACAGGTPPAGEQPSGPVAPPTTDAEMLRSAMAAAPDAVSGAATILAFDEHGASRTLRAGTNGWTCLPDMPHSPGADPMCLDEAGMAWLMALLEKRDPPEGRMGFGYMLAGGSDASNTDPHAMEPVPGQPWIDTGPHVMVFNIGQAFPGYPTTSANTKAPYVMWPDTPYAHLMIPVR